MTTDEAFVQNILVNEEYNPIGYEIAPTDTVIDIGGNIGAFSLMAAQKANKGRILTFEPVSENYRLLLENINRNSFTNIVPHRTAILDRRCRIRIHLHPDNTGAHSVFGGSRTKDTYEIVEAIPLQDVFDNYAVTRCDFLKMDCEGAEYQILYALPKEYFGKIDRIVLEYHTTPDPRGVDAIADELVDYLETNGYFIDAYLSFGGGGFIRARRSAADNVSLKTNMAADRF